MLNSGKDSVSAHLEKNIISNIIQTARASLKEPSRPYTPSESQRALFSTADSNRPPSSYSIRSLSKDLEPIKQRPVILDQPIQVSRKVMNEESKSLPRKPVKVPQEPKEMKKEEKEFRSEEENEILNELKNIIGVLERMKFHSEVRDLYEDKDLEELLENFTTALTAVKYIGNKPQWATCEEALKVLALTLVSFEEDIVKIMKIAKCLLENVTNFEILYLKKSKSIKINPLALGAVKVLYQFSKRNENDVLFIKEKLSDTMYTLLINIVSEDPYIEIDLPYDFLIFLLGTLKNISNSQLFIDNSIKLISPLTSLLPTPLLDESAHRNAKHPNLLVQVTGILKNLTTKSTLSDLLNRQIIEKLVLSMQVYKDPDLVLNCFKIISKISLDENVCKVLQSSLNVLFKTLKDFENPLILARACYVIANVLTIFEDTRACVDRTSVILLVNISNKYLKSTEIVHVDLLVKSIRLLANIVSASHIGESIECADVLVKMLVEVMIAYNIEEYEELVLNTVACLTNLLYFDVPGKELINHSTRILAFSKLSPTLVSNFNEELTSETLRALGNLTRHDSLCTELPSLYMIDIFMLLLNHSNWTVIYYDLGCLINISSLAKELLYCEKYFEALIGVLQETNVFEPVLSTQLFMIFCNLCTASKGMVPWESVAGEESVKKLSGLVKEIVDESKDTLTTDPEFLKLIAVGENLLSLMPKPLLPCTFEGCGRKFATSELLQDHWARRHA